MGENPSHKPFLFFVTAFVFFILTIALVFLSLQKQKTTTGTPTPTVNPAAQVENPFSQQSTYQNPFSATDSGSTEYKNPFEQLR